MRPFLILMCLLGTLLPFSQFIPWLMQHGLDPLLLLEQAATSRIAAFAWLDVLVSALVLIAFIWVEGRRLGMPRLWLPTLATCGVGVSLGLPLFLLLRDYHLNKATA